MMLFDRSPAPGAKSAVSAGYRSVTGSDRPVAAHFALAHLQGQI